MLHVKNHWSIDQWHLTDQWFCTLIPPVLTTSQIDWWNVGFKWFIRKEAIRFGFILTGVVQRFRSIQDESFQEV